MGGSLAQATAARLWREVISEEKVRRPIDFGWVNGNRLASLDDEKHFFTGSGSDVISLSVSTSTKRPKVEDDAKTLVEEYMVPSRIPLCVEVHKLLELSILRSDVVTIAAKPGQLAATDGFGNVVVGMVNAGGADDRGDVEVASSYALRPARFEQGELGWAGLALDTRPSSALIVSARYFFRDCTVYDRDIAVRTFDLPGAPTAVEFVDDGRVAVAEGNVLSLWDLRVGGMSACTARRAVALGNMYSLDCSGTLLGAAGRDRDVRVFDVRTLGAVGHWSNCLKYSCRAVFLRADGSSCFVAGSDNEAACGVWNPDASTEQAAEAAPRAPKMVSGALARSPRRLFGFRGDAPWAGVCTSGNLFAGFSTSGALYLLRGPTP